MSIPEIEIKVTSVFVRSKYRKPGKDIWIDIGAEERMLKIVKILNKIK